MAVEVFDANTGNPTTFTPQIEKVRSRFGTPAVRSDAAITKAQTKRTSDNFPVHSFQTLLTDLATITNNRIQSTLSSTRMIFDKITTPTPLQQKAFDLLGVSVFCTQ